MIFDPEIYCTAAETRELDGKDAVTLAGAGLWAGVLSRGECLLEGLARPGQSGDILLGPSPLALTPQTDCHLVAVRLTGLCAAFLQKAAVNADLAELVLDQHHLLACKGLGDQLFDQSSFAGAKEAGEDIDFSHDPNASFFLSQYSQLLAQRAAEC